MNSTNSIEQIKKIYFSPTGGTKKAVDIISGIWAEPAEDIDISKKEEDYGRYIFSDKELCLIGVPSFGGRVPDIALKNIRAMKGNDTPAILIITYGNRDYDDTILELKDVLNEHGFICLAAIAAVTEHSIMRQYGTGRPDADDEKELKAYSAQVKAAIEGDNKSFRELADMLRVPGSKPYREYKGVPMRPKTSGLCTECGVCARLCPVGAIPDENPKATEADKCISCMRCIQVCPTQARKCSAVILAAASQKMKKACAGRKKNELFLEK